YAGELVAARSGPPSSSVLGRGFGFCPIVRLRLAGFENFLGFKAGRHRSRRAGQHLMMLDIEKPQPTLLPQRKPDHAAELDKFRLLEMATHTVPELVAGVEPPNDGLGVGERRLLTFIIFRRLLEIQKVKHLLFDQGAARGCLHRALVAAIFAGDRAGNVEAAQFLDRVIEDAVAENVVPGIGEKPKTGGHNRANGRAFRPRRAFALTALHFRPHFGVHFFERDVADPLLGHFLTLFLDILTFTAAPRSNGVTYHGQNTSEIEVKRWPYRRNLPGGARVAHHMDIDEGFSSHSRAALRLRAKGLDAQARPNFKAAPAAIHHLKQTLRLSAGAFVLPLAPVRLFILQSPPPNSACRTAPRADATSPRRRPMSGFRPTSRFV